MTYDNPTRPAYVYADGGVLFHSRSPFGGTWAWRHVNRAGDVVCQEAGVAVPRRYARQQIDRLLDVPTHVAPLETVTNNYTELLAALHGLEALPDRWSGTVCSDSQITLGRISGQYRKMNGIPEAIQERLRVQRRRLGEIRVRLLAGHPSKDDLTAGTKAKNGVLYPVSLHNVWCDARCTDLGRRLANAIGASPDLFDF